MLAGAWDYLAGLVLGTIGLLRRNRPRLRAHPLKLAQSAVTNSVLRHASLFWLRQDLVRGVPVIYSNFVGYDDVAHYSGPDDYEALVTLAAFDRGLRKLRRFMRRHGRPRCRTIWSFSATTARRPRSRSGPSTAGRWGSWWPTASGRSSTRENRPATPPTST